MERRKKTKNIKSLCYEVDPEKLVFFEQFDVTLARSESKNPLLNPVDDEDEESESEEEKILKLLERTAGYSTPTGLIAVPEYSDGTKQFKFWTMYLKIKITEGLKNAIDNIDGVESFEQYTPYRARISVAPLFVDNIVLNKIKKQIKDYVSLKHKNPDV